MKQFTVGDVYGIVDKVILLFWQWMRRRNQP